MKMKPLVSAIDSFINRTGRGFVLILLPLIGIIGYEVVVRFVFDRPTVWAHETASLVFGAYVVLLGGYTLLYNQHVKVDILWDRLSPRRKAIWDLATSVFGFIFIVSLLWFSVIEAWHSVEIREISVTVFGPPLYPSRIILVIATFLFLVQMISKFIRDLYGARGTPYTKEFERGAGTE